MNTLNKIKTRYQMFEKGSVCLGSGPSSETFEKCTHSIWFIVYNYVMICSFNSVSFDPRPCPRLHAMYLWIPSPLSERLSIKPENDPRQTEEKNQTHVRHNRRDVSTLDNPRGDEFRESVAPNVLVDRDGNEDWSCDGLVRIDRVCRRDGWEGSNLNSGASVANNDNYLFLVSIA